MPHTATWTDTAATNPVGDLNQPRAHAARLVGERSLFMRNHVTCPACRLKQSFTRRSSADSLHVRFTATEMVVTEIDDLHQPGRSIRCEEMLSFPGGLMFQVTALQLPEGGRNDAITGMAFLSRRNQKWHLKIFGHAPGMEAVHDCLFDAVEEF